MTSGGRPRLTPRGRGVLAAAAVLLLAARLLGSSELAGLAAAALLSVAAGALRVRRSPVTVRADRRLAPARVGVGAAAEARVRFTNTGRATTPPAEAVDRATLMLHRLGRLTAGPGVLPRLVPGAVAEARYDLPTGRRGAVTVGPLAIRVSDPFGLVERQVEVAGTDRLIVHPRIHPLLALPGSPTREARHGSAAAARAARGDDFFTLREYEVGDDLRRVHWRSTARHGDLMLRQDEVRFGEVATVLLDTRASAHTGDSFDRALEAAASIAAALVGDGRRLRFLTTGGFDVRVDGTRARLLGARAESRWSAVLEHLALLSPEDNAGTDGFSRAIQAVRRHPSGPLAAVVGDATAAELAALASLRPRLGVVMVATCAPQPAASAGRSPSVPRATVLGAGPGHDFAAEWNAAVLANRVAGSPTVTARSAAGPDPAAAAGSESGVGPGSKAVERRRLAALVGVSLAAALGSARLFEDAGWVVPALGAVAGAHAVGALTRRRPIGVTVVAHVAALAALLLERVGGHAAFGVPTAATFAALLRAIGRAPEAVRAAIVPAPTRPELVLLVIAGLWVAAGSADWLARRRAGLVAVLPPAAFPIVVAALGTARWRLPLTFAVAATTACYAAWDRQARLPQGSASLLDATGRAPRRLSWVGAARPGPSGARRRGRGASGGGAVAPALAIGVAAIVLGPAVPGIGRAAVDVHAFGVTLDVSRVELNPLVDIRPHLLTDRRTELFTVRSAAPAYWRLTALDRFDGRRWSPSRPALYRRDGPPIAADGSAGKAALHQDFVVAALDSPWLPAAGKAIRVRAAGARLDPETDSLVTKKGSRFVRAYRVESELPPDPGGRHPSAPAAAGQPAALTRYLTLPRDFPGAVRELAQRFTAGSRTPYERAAALEDSLRAGFIYDETAPPGASVHALADFLLRSRRGYCEQFAGAYAAMARTLGLPARVAVGFTPGTYDETTGVWRVTTREAHAWPEVYLAGLGWTPFEPTPGRVLPDPDTRVRPSNTVERLAAARSAGASQSSVLARIDPGGAGGVDAGPGGRPSGLTGAVTHRRTIWWTGLAALGLLAVPPAVKTRRRNVRRRAPGREAVLAAWTEALDRLGEAGLARQAQETPLELARRVAARRPGVGPAVRQLAGLVNGAAYARRNAVSGPCATEAWAACERLVRALDAHDSWLARWRRRLDPRPLLRR